MKKVILGVSILAILAVSLAIVGMSHNNAPPAKSKVVIATDKHSFQAKSDDFVDPYLSHGAKAEWAASGFGVLDASGENAVGKVIIHGADDRDIKVTAKFRAVIVPLNKSLDEIVVNVPKGESVEIPVDMRFALGMHDKQAEYTTRIHADFSVKYDSGPTLGYFQSLEPRYLAVNEISGAYEIMDFETREQKYPFGFTTAEGIDKAQELAAESAQEGYVLDGIGPGIVITDE